VDDDGLARGGGDVRLGGEGELLCGDVGVLDVVVVEANLADGDAEGVGGKGGDFLESVLGGLRGFRGMDSGGGEDAWCAGSAREGLCKVEGLVHGGGALTDSDSEDCRDSGGLGTCQDFISVSGALCIEVEMCVRVYEHVFRAPPLPYLRKVFERCDLGLDFMF